MQYSTRRFNYYKEDREFSQEASSLPQFNGGELLVLVSTRTGAKKAFKLKGREYNDSGYEEELVAWHYVPVDGSDLHLTVWND